MTDNVIGTVPEFTNAEEAEVKPVEPEVKPTETETQVEPSTTEKPAEEQTVHGEDIAKVELTPEEVVDLQKQREGLLIEKNSILTEIQDLRRQRRGLREEALPPATQKDVDELKDLHPEDVATIDRILKAKGYMSKTELDKSLYEGVKNEEVSKFLDKYPEYKPENDVKDIKWLGLQNVLKQWYRLPENPKQIGQVLEKAHKDLLSTISGGLASNLEATKQQLKTASLGTSGIGKGAKGPSSLESFDADKVYALRSGGYTDEEITKILNKLET